MVYGCQNTYDFPFVTLSEAKGLMLFEQEILRFAQTCPEQNNEILHFVQNDKERKNDKE